MAGSYEIPAEGSSDATQEPKIKTFMESWNAKLNSENDLEDTGLASPSNKAYRTILAGTQSLGGEVANGTYLVSATEGNGVSAAGGNLGGGSLPLLYFAKADYEVAGKTQKLRLRAQCLTNATKPTGVTFTVSLYNVASVAGGSGEMKVTLGTGVGNVKFEEPAASTVSQSSGSEITIPSDGVYALAINTSLKLPAGVRVLVSAQVQTKSV